MGEEQPLCAELSITCPCSLRHIASAGRLAAALSQVVGSILAAVAYVVTIYWVRRRLPVIFCCCVQSLIQQASQLHITRVVSAAGCIIDEGIDRREFVHMCITRGLCESELADERLFIFIVMIDNICYA